MDLILDFDGTITCVDTIAAIASTAAWRRSILQTAGHAQRQRQRTDSVLSNDSGRDGIDRNDCPPTVPFMGVPKQEENTWKTLVDAYIADLALYKASNRRTAEERSVARVSASKFLAGASKSDLCSVGARLETKLGWREFCVAWNDMRFRYPEKIRDPVICSLNWSKDLVSACLSASGLITPERNVLTNDLTYTSDGLTSGTLNAPLLTGEDKVQALESLLRDAPGKLRVYVGDR
ncbi:hypothetical protein DFJ73DRAFT_249513 [Zopfochytrium polystomum]|nr:hypothetical protein DFJ73DRAFT_249513 [Zopfochytrium polystomum]